MHKIISSKNKNKSNRIFLNDSLISYSKLAKSFESLIKILPNGILSKNSFKGAYNKLTIIFLWRILEFSITPWKTTKVLKNENIPTYKEREE